MRHHLVVKVFLNRDRLPGLVLVGCLIDFVVTICHFLYTYCEAIKLCPNGRSARHLKWITFHGANKPQMPATLTYQSYLTYKHVVWYTKQKIQEID